MYITQAFAEGGKVRAESVKEETLEKRQEKRGKERDRT